MQPLKLMNPLVWPTWLEAKDATNAPTVGQKMKTVRMTRVGVANSRLACRPWVRTVPPPLPVIVERVDFGVVAVRVTTLLPTLLGTRPQDSKDYAVGARVSIAVPRRGGEWARFVYPRRPHANFVLTIWCIC